MLPVFLAYLLSFVFLGIYWNNHHHMMLLTDESQRRDLVGQPSPACSGCRSFRSRWGG